MTGGAVHRLCSLRVLVAALALAAAFVLLSGQSLPPLVASHFAAGGHADAFMPRVAYLGLMLGMVAGVPLLLVLAQGLVRRVPPRMVSLPHRDYWLAPERAADTLAYLRSHGVCLSLLLAVFLCYVHWLVVRANGLQPPQFPPAPFLAGLTVFLAAVVVWVGMLLLRFGRRS
jgi:hypothetical protein